MRVLNSVMLVDDDITTNFLHEVLFHEMQVAKELVVAVNGLEAIEKLQELSSIHNYCPELILVDINMPVMNGFEFVEVFNKMYEDTIRPPVIVMVSSSVHPEDLEKAKKLNVQGYIPKPLDEEELKKVLKEYFS